MPGHKEHLKSSLFFAVVVIFIGLYYNLITLIEAVIAAALIPLYGLLPDADSFNSHVRNYLLIGGTLATIISLLLLKTYLAISILLMMLALTLIRTHRDFMHSITMAAVISFPVYYWISPKVAILTFAAFIIHLLMDKSFKLF